MFTHCSPCKAHHNARRRIVVKSIGRKYRLANKIGKVVARDVDGVGLTFHQLVRCFTEYLQHYLLTKYLPLINWRQPNNFIMQNNCSSTDSQAVMRNGRRFKYFLKEYKLLH